MQRGFKIYRLVEMASSTYKLRTCMARRGEGVLYRVVRSKFQGDGSKITAWRRHEFSFERKRKVCLFPCVIPAT